MQVNSSTLSMVSQHAASTTTHIEEQIEIRRPSASTRTAVSQAPNDDLDITDMRTLLALLLYEQLTGRKGLVPRRGHPFKGALSQQQTSPPAVAYSRREIHHEAESSSFSAQGTVTLATGEKIEFSLQLNLNRELTQVNTVTFNTGKSTDPIAVNLDGLGVRLNPSRRQFDLNSDGMDETIATLAEGSAWLAIDANANGFVDNGTELFGPKSGNGFSELAALDEDHNGWIDEADAAYHDLGLWNGEAITSLHDAGIGALAVSSIATPFALKEGAETLGDIRSASVYLRENGAPGILQQVDLKA